MKKRSIPSSLALFAALAVTLLAVPAVAQQSAAPAVSSQSAPAAQTAPSVAQNATIEPARPLRLPATPHELSPWSMFLSADWVVKAVMIGLAFASVLTWTIFIAKSIELLVMRRRLDRDLAVANDARSLVEAQRGVSDNGVSAAFLNAALREARQSAGISSDQGVKERAASSFTEITRAEARRSRLGMGLLATIGSTSPFVGLFGTVWGIMNSFIGISKSQTTNLAVVAPGIAEALLATAIGLVAAIPAVIIYNHFSRQTKTYLEIVGRASGAAGRLLSRDLERAHGGAMSRAAE
ncbi:MAG: biopolymer transport protein ExbB [Proteobacteria bacterium SG_bin9]|nr:MAG: biopolymer transport protein ExbB [Proteobacteria bacterium SG_bin9]